MPTRVLGEDEQPTGRSAPRRRNRPVSPRALQCPACGSSNVAQMLGDNGGVSYVCTACGHSWS
ncbi:hypothetical protein [Streptomyces sp. HNM0574]|uniref:hypothetical protein n=1 Tax=Streptomyces sp. HNM0574 TaxID=2714954 RepID=UPI00146E0BE4|nr:hypothetical protein [Streptomyces sp. HNM0574]NLU69110.1 hypothetical protein [Streptomyces sp. HNM0574]